MTARASALDALRSPNFALLWTAQVVSGFGDKITLFALAYITWELTRSALSTTLAIVVGSLPFAVFGFVGGAIADAVGHRRAMIACDVIRVIVVGLIPVALAAGSPLSVPYALVLIATLCSAVFMPARMGVVPDLVPREHLGPGNALVYASDRVVEVVGAVIAGFIVAALGILAFYVDAATFAISAVLLMRISIPESPARSIRWASIWADVAEGLRFLSANAVLRANTVFSLLAQLSLPVLNGLTPVLVFREFGRGPEGFGLAEAALAIGAVAAGLALPGVLGQFPKGRLIVIGFAAYGLTLLAIAAAPTFEALLALFFVAGVTNVLFFIPNVTLAQEITPQALRARVFGSRTALLHLTWLPVIVLSGTLADHLPAAALIAAAGVVTLVVALGGASTRSVRDAS